MSDESTPEAPQPSEMAMLRAEMRAGFQSVEKRFDDVDRRLEGHDRRFDEVDRRFDTIDRRLEGHDKRFDEVDQRFDEVDRRFDEVDRRFDEVDQRFAEVDKRHVTMDARITEEEAATRRHIDIVAESLRGSLNVVIDKTTATGEKVDRLIASNATEHAAFLDALTDHEVRITRLETARSKGKPATT